MGRQLVMKIQVHTYLLQKQLVSCFDGECKLKVPPDVKCARLITNSLNLLLADGVIV